MLLDIASMLLVWYTCYIMVYSLAILATALCQALKGARAELQAQREKVGTATIESARPCDLAPAVQPVWFKLISSGLAQG